MDDSSTALLRSAHCFFLLLVYTASVVFLNQRLNLMSLQTVFFTVFLSVAASCKYIALKSSSLGAGV